MSTTAALRALARLGRHARRPGLPCRGSARQRWIGMSNERWDGSKSWPPFQAFAGQPAGVVRKRSEWRFLDVVLLQAARARRGDDKLPPRHYILGGET